MAFAEKYVAQVALLLEVMPFVAKEKSFALKGGTAINMFCQDLPRLSVDLDLVYLPLENREESYSHINEALLRIADRLGSGGYAVSLQGNSEKKIVVANHAATVKIEPNYTIRGSVLVPELRSVLPRVNERFGYAKVNVLAREELYAGKLCAALDRQHPRDLFDVKLMFEKSGGISDEMLSCFVVYALGHNRPLHELLDCVIKDNATVFEKEFKGMTDSDVSYTDLIGVLQSLKNELRK